MTRGEKIRQAMRLKGWNQSELARRAGLPRNTITYLVNDERGCNAANLQKVAFVLEIDLASLLSPHVPLAADPDTHTVQQLRDLLKHEDPSIPARMRQAIDMTWRVAFRKPPVPVAEN